jgi:aspartate kinase
MDTASVLNAHRDQLASDNVIVVVSAMSSTIKSEGTTTRLIQAAQHAVKGQVAEYRRLLNLILTSHLVAIHEAMGASEVRGGQVWAWARNGKIMQDGSLPCGYTVHFYVLSGLQASSQLQESITEDIDSVRRFLDAIEVIGELSPASEDFIIGTGEKLSAKILASVFNHHVWSRWIPLRRGVLIDQLVRQPPFSSLSRLAR